MSWIDKLAYTIRQCKFHIGTLGLNDERAIEEVKWQLEQDECIVQLTVGG